MKRLALALISCALILALSGCKCSVEKQAVSQVDASHAIIATQLLKYVDADAKLDAAAKADWRKLVESDKRNIDALKKSME